MENGFKKGDIVFDKTYFPEVKEGIVTSINNTHIVVRYEGFDFKYTFKGQYIKDDYIFSESTLEKSEESYTTLDIILSEYKQRILNHLLNGRYCITNVKKDVTFKTYTIRFYEGWKEFQIQVGSCNIYLKDSDIYLKEYDKILSSQGKLVDNPFKEILVVLEKIEKQNQIEIIKNQLEILKVNYNKESRELEIELSKLENNN